jgi:hypothetical protein
MNKLHYLEVKLVIITAICFLLFQGSLITLAYGRHAMALIYIAIPLIPITLHYLFKINCFPPIWHKHIVSKIKYLLFIIQGALLIFGHIYLSDKAFTYITISFVSLNILLVAIGQFITTRNLLYFIPACYLVYKISFINMESSSTYLYIANGLPSSFIIDYSLWFIMYPKIGNRFPILLHTAVPLITYTKPEHWIVARSFIGSIILFMTYNNYTYEKLFNTTEQADYIDNFQTIYKKLYIVIFGCRMISEFM